MITKITLLFNIQNKEHKLMLFIFRNQAHDGALQLHSIRSSSNSHQSNIPPLEPVHADGRYHASSSSTGGENMVRDGNRTEPQYSMYVYQQWAKLNPEAAANSHPPNASDLITRVGKVCARILMLDLHIVIT